MLRLTGAPLQAVWILRWLSTPRSAPAEGDDLFGAWAWGPYFAATIIAWLAATSAWLASRPDPDAPPVPLPPEIPEARVVR